MSTGGEAYVDPYAARPADGGERLPWVWEPDPSAADPHDELRLLLRHLAPRCHRVRTDLTLAAGEWPEALVETAVSWGWDPERGYGTSGWRTPLTEAEWNLWLLAAPRSYDAEAVDLFGDPVIQTSDEGTAAIVRMSPAETDLLPRALRDRLVPRFETGGRRWYPLLMVAVVVILVAGWVRDSIDRFEAFVIGSLLVLWLGRIAWDLLGRRRRRAQARQPAPAWSGWLHRGQLVEQRSRSSLGLRSDLVRARLQVVDDRLVVTPSRSARRWAGCSEVRLPLDRVRRVEVRDIGRIPRDLESATRLTEVVCVLEGAGDNGGTALLRLVTDTPDGLAEALERRAV